MMVRILGVLWKLTKVIITVLLIAMAALIILPKVFGIQTLVVLSGSMEPAYPVGSLIYVKDIDAKDIKVDDVITFKKDLGSGVSNVTHRVVRIDEENQCFYTKGDANASEDATPTMFSNIVGKPFFDIPYLGYIGTYIGSQSGKILGFTVILCLLIIFYFPDFLRKKVKIKNG